MLVEGGGGVSELENNEKKWNNIPRKMRRDSVLYIVH